MTRSPGQSQETAPEEELVDRVGLMIVSAVIISCVEWAVAGRIDYLALVASVIIVLALALTGTSRRSIRRPSKAFLAVVGSYAAVLATVLSAYPLFPIIESGDFFVHLSNALDFANGSQASLPANPAVSMLLSSWLSIDLGATLLMTRVFIALLLLVSVAPVYALGYRAGKKDGAIVASLVYVFTSPLMGYTLLVTGLYANLLGITVGLFAIVWFTRALDAPSSSSCAKVMAAGFVLVLAHSTDVLLIGALLASYLYIRFIELHKVHFEAPIFLALGVAIALVLAPSLLLRLPAATEGAAVAFVPSNILGRFLSFSPFLQWVFFFEGGLVLLLVVLSLAISTLVTFRRKLAISAVPFFWFLLTWSASLFSPSMNAWRFSLLSTAPFALLCVPLYIVALKPIYQRLSRAMPLHMQRAFDLEVAASIVVILVLFGSANPFPFALTSSSTRAEQESFNEALMWLGANTPSDCRIVNVGAWQMNFLELVAHRDLTTYLAGPDQVLEQFGNESLLYVVVWNRLYNVSDVSGGYYLDLYKSSQFFSEVWSDKEITVFLLSSQG